MLFYFNLQMIKNAATFFIALFHPSPYRGGPGLGSFMVKAPETGYFDEVTDISCVCIL